MSQVAILLASYNGAAFIEKQLASIAAQHYTDWRLYISDDVSQDETVPIIKNFAQAHAGKVQVNTHTQNKGFAANFLSLICDETIDSPFYALSDQDDVWLPEKLSRAVAWLETMPEEVPALYCTRTEAIDEEGKSLGLSPLFARPPAFANALVQSIAGGNTMVMNRAARILLAKVSINVDIVSHDWWAYMVISGAGGNIYYDASPSLKYRQHEGNIIGANNSFWARLVRMKYLLKGRFKAWNEKNVAALEAHKHILTPENQELFERYVSMRKSSFLARCKAVKLMGIYRQTRVGHIGLYVAALLGKL